MRSFFLPLFLLFFLGSCSRFHSTRYKDIPFGHTGSLKLDVYKPKTKSEKKDILVFIHGGNWSNGSKKLYRFFGRGMARKGILTVVIDFRQYPSATYSGMAMDAAEAVAWIRQHAAEYGGDPEKIFVAGHSAGAHLAALISTDNSYFDSLEIKSPVKGCILIDPFGLDMYTYLKKEEPYKYDVYRTVFTKDSVQWKRGSPVNHLHPGMPPFMLFRGGRTYPNIVEGTDRFAEALKKYQPDASVIVVPRKRHAGMIFSYTNPRKKAYGQILEFMRKSGS